MKFIHLSDCHLSNENKFSNKINEMIRKKSWESFEYIFTENKNVDFAMIAGDLFERSYFTKSDYEKLFNIIKNFKKNIYYVTGNHDYINYDNEIFLLDKPSNLKIFSSQKIEYLEENNTRIYGISYEDRIFSKEFDYDLKLDSTYFNILLLHGVYGEKKSNYLNLDINRLQKIGFDYVGLGHIHKPLTVTKNIMYSGTTEAKDFSENLDYGYILYDQKQIKRINCSQIKFNELKITTSDFINEDDLINYILDNIGKKINFLRLKVKNDSNLIINSENIKSKLNLYYLELVEEKVYDYKDLKILYENSLLDRFLEKSKNIPDDKINKRAKELAIDAILRSRYE